MGTSCLSEAWSAMKAAKSGSREPMLRMLRVLPEYCAVSGAFTGVEEQRMTADSSGRRREPGYFGKAQGQQTGWRSVALVLLPGKKTGSVVGSTVHVLSVHLFGQQSLCSQCVWASCLQLCLHGSLWVYSLSLFSSCPAADPPSLSAVLIRLSTRRRVAPRQEPWTGSTCPQPGEKGAEGKTDASTHQHGHLLFCRKKPMISQVRRALFL